MSSSDRVEKEILLRAPRSRVWRAVTDSSQFGTWFRAKLEAQFNVGARVRGKITHPGYEHLTLELLVERMDAERLFSFRWHPYAIDPRVDYSAEPTTLVEFRLEEAAEGTHLTVVESGFEHIPLARRSEAFRMNSQGWEAQLENIRQYLADVQASR